MSERNDKWENFLWASYSIAQEPVLASTMFQHTNFHSTLNYSSVSVMPLAWYCGHIFSFMTVMKKKLIIIAVLVIALVTSYIFCGTDKNDTGIDSIKIEEYTAALSNKIDLDYVAGTYYGILPSNVETTLTLNADGTYLLTRTFKEKRRTRQTLWSRPCRC